MALSLEPSFSQASEPQNLLLKLKLNTQKLVKYKSLGVGIQ